MAFDFNAVKPIISQMTAELDEYVLLPKSSPFLEIVKSPSSVRVQYGKKEYVLPVEDVRVLPVVNVTAEELARYLADELVQRLRAVPTISSVLREVRIGVQESRGQTVFYHLHLK